jgi:ABC-type transport system involved in multi-copper enzyme maturation permease subunit
VGPLFYYELVRLSRQGRSTSLRCAYAAALLVALYFAYRERFPRHDLWAAPFAPPQIPTSELASLAQGFVLAILRVQTVAVFVLTPVYLAGAVAEEKERATLELLFTTQLSDREIVLGKLAARVTHLGGILLAGLPLLAATQLWGGVDIRLLAGAFAMSGLNLLTVGAASVLTSVYARTTWQATTRAYAASAVLFVVYSITSGFTPAGMFILLNTLADRLWTLKALPAVLVGPVIQVIVAKALGRMAVARLRQIAIAQASARAVRDPALGPEADEPTATARRRIAPPPVRDRPLLWREVSRSGWGEFAREFEYGVREDWLAAIVLASIILVFLGAMRYSVDAAVWDEGVGAIMRLAGVGLAATWCVGTAFRAAGSISLEREKGTLDGLLTMPIARDAIPGAKWLGSVLRGRDLGYALCVVGVFGLINGLLHPAALLLVAASVAAHLGFWASVGLYLSVSCRSTLRARVTMALLLLAFAGGLLYLAGSDTPGRYGYEPGMDFMAVVVNPLRAWWFLAFGWRKQPGPVYAGALTFDVRLGAATLGTAAFALASGLLWLGACRRFRKE